MQMANTGYEGFGGP